jgi:solute carrier family 25 uncoupling protein 8/9
MSKSRISTVGMVRKIVAEEGLKALWKGVGPAMVRAGCLTASQMATYDEAKQVSSSTMLSC